MDQGLWGVKQGFEGDEQKSEAGKQRCTVINMDEAGFPLVMQQTVISKGWVSTPCQKPLQRGSLLA